MDGGGGGVGRASKVGPGRRRGCRTVMIVCMTVVKLVIEIVIEIDHFYSRR